MKLQTMVLATIGISGVGYGGYSFVDHAVRDVRESGEECGRKLQESDTPIEATVLEDVYQSAIVPVDAWQGIISRSNPSLTLSSMYTLKVQTKEGKILGINVVSTEQTPKETLDRILKEGSQISFPRGNLCQARFGLWMFPEETYFNQNTQTGSKRADRIKVLKP